MPDRSPRDVEPMNGAGRRALMKTAAWSVPVMAAAMAAPAFAVSPTVVAVGGISLSGTCGIAGLMGQGYLLRAGGDPIPAGSQVVITSDIPLGELDLALAGDGGAGLSGLGTTRIRATLTEDLMPTESLQISILLIITQLFSSSAMLTLPSGYAPSETSSTTGATLVTAEFCSAN